MPPSTHIARLGFKPAREERLGIELMSIAELQRRGTPEHFARPQRADFFHLIGVTAGQTAFTVDFTPCPATVRDWLLIRPGQVMRYDFSRPWSGWLAVFRPDSVFTRTRGSSTDELELLRRVEDMACVSSLQREQHAWMCRSLGLMDADSRLAAGIDLRNELMRLQLAGTLLRLSVWQDQSTVQADRGHAALENFKRFRQLLEVQFAQHRQVQHYAGRLGMGEKNLSRACLAGAGVPAKAYIAQRVVLEAKRLLAHTTLSVQAIAGQLGFDEATNFVKFFRREAELTPARFRRLQAPQR